jgi:FkbM family methyltransferase
MRVIRQWLTRLANGNPYFWYIGWSILPHFSFLLPHEKSYYAFRHLGTGADGLFLDVGANNGLSAQGFRKLVPNYRIFSVEANRHHEPSLKRLAQKMRRFEYLIAAAGSVRANLTLYTASYRGIKLHTGTSLSQEHMKSGYAHNFSPSVVKDLVWSEDKVDVIPLDELGLKPDIIKTDAEGYDYEVLAGLSDTIKAHRPHVLIEFSAEMIDRLTSFCNELNYGMYVYDWNRDCFSSFDSARELSELASGVIPVNLFLMPAEKTRNLPFRT